MYARSIEHFLPKSAQFHYFLIDTHKKLLYNQINLFITENINENSCHNM